MYSTWLAMSLIRLPNVPAPEAGAAAVGEAATRAVVTGMVLVIVACGVYAVLFSRLGV